MKLAIFGASGATGAHLVRQALAAGHDVTVLLRNATGLPVQHARERNSVIFGRLPHIQQGYIRFDLGTVRHGFLRTGRHQHLRSSPIQDTLHRARNDRIVFDQ